MKLGRFLALLAGFGLLFTIGLLAFNFLVMPRLVHHNPVVAVPDLKGHTLEQARGEAGRAGLQVVEERTVAHPTAPAGRIVDQSPRGGAAIRRGRRVTVVVSGGPAAGAVPDVAGLSRRQAEMTLRRDTFRAGRVLRFRDPGVAVPTVAFQYPPPGSNQRKDAAIDLVVAEPGLPPAYRMPDLRGVPLYRARLAIEAAGCVAAGVSYRRDSAAAGTVVAQSPAPGSMVMKGASVELVASGR